MKRFIAGVLISVLGVSTAAGAYASQNQWPTDSQVQMPGNQVQQGLEYGATNLQISTTMTAHTTATVNQPMTANTTTTGTDNNYSQPGPATNNQSSTSTSAMVGGNNSWSSAASGSAANTNTSTGGTYAALGDSVAAGMGLQDGVSDSICGRTQQGYPNIVAQKRNLQLVYAACSGATAGDLATQQGVSGPNIQAQLDQAFANGTPSLITITAGANDMQWLQFVKKCATATCGTAADTTATSALRTAMEVKYRYALDQINARSNGQPPRVVITGYYNPISNYCKGRQQYVSNEEIDWLNSQRDQLNKAIRNIGSQYKNVRYASTNFNGHTICAKQPWVQGLNDPAPLHPNAMGQQMIAKSVLSKI